MKKLILSTLVAGVTAAGTAGAATVYEGNGLTYKVNGDWQIQLRQDVGDDQDLNVDFDDLEVKNRIEYDLGNGLTAFGQLDFGFKNDANGTGDGSHLEEAYVGLDFGAATVAIGQMDLAGDNFGIEAQYENTLSEDRFEAVRDNGDDVIRVTTELAGVSVIATAELEAESEASGDGEAFDLFAATRFGAVDVAAAYQSVEEAGSDIDTWGVSAAWDAGFATLAADYSASDTDAGDIDQYNLVAIVPVAATTKVAVGVANIEEDGTEDKTEWYANVTYAFANQPNVSVFAEIADTDEDNADLGGLVGMRLKF